MRSRIRRRDFITQTVSLAALGAGAACAGAPRVGAASPDGAGMVQTVTGPISVDRLGFTLPHEHLFSSSAGFWRAWPEFMGGRAAFIEKAADRLKALRDEGVDTIVDLTTADLGRDVGIAQEVSQRSGMQIIAATGHWLHPVLSMSSRSAEELTAFFLRELHEGIEDTDIRAGVIKVATDREGMTPFLEKALRAAARASKETGAAVETHSYSLPPDPTGPLQADIFEAEGLDPARVSIGHSDYGDVDYLLGLIGRGFTVGMDHMSRGILPPGQPAPEGMEPYLWQAKTERVKALIDAGHADKILLSNDWLFADSLFATGTVEAMDSTNPDGMAFLTRKALPYLKELGVSDRDIRVMTVDNPRRLFGGR